MIRRVFPRPASFAFTLALFLLLPAVTLPAQNAGLGESEAQKCEEKIASVRRDVLSKYDDTLNELQVGFQKAADLEGALAIRDERQRLANEQALADKDVVTVPKSLRTAQMQTLGKLKELITQLVQETVPRLIELKRSLTIAGKLDEAVAVRAAIERLQNSHAPVSRPDPGSVVTADALLQAYAADRARADKTYKGQKMAVRGVIGGFRQDQADSKFFHVFLAGANGGWVQCAFSTAEYRFREEQQFNNTFLIVTAKAGEGSAMRWQKGQSADIRGVCDGFDDVVRLSKCDVVR
jgi:hypothetical protein